MSAALNRRVHAMVALPVMLSVVLVALCLPVACAVASPMPNTAVAGAMMPAMTSAPAPDTCDMQVPRTHTHGRMPLHHDTGSSPEACKHRDVPAQAVTGSQQVLVDQVVAPALAADMTPVLPEAPVVRPAVRGAIPPSGVLLTASQLRI